MSGDDADQGVPTVADWVMARAMQPLPSKGQFTVRRLEEIIGARMLSRRTELDLTQEQVGERVGRRLGREWTRQAVSAAEKGRRAFAAAELVAIANVLGDTVAGLLTPPDDVDLIKLGDLTSEGGAITPGQLAWVLVSTPVVGEAYWDLQNAVLRLGQHAQVVVDAIQFMAEDLSAITGAVKASESLEEH